MRWSLGLVVVLFAISLLGCERVEGTPVTWDTDFDSSLEEAKAAGQPTLVYFTADWCTFCREFEQDLENSPRLQQELATFNLIKVDVDASPEIVEKFNLRGPPAWQVLDEEGLPVGKITGYAGERDLRNTLNEFSL